MGKLISIFMILLILSLIYELGNVLTYSSQLSRTNQINQIIGGK